MAYQGFEKVAKQTGSPELAAWIGRRKYGAKRFNQAAAKGQSLRGVPGKAGHAMPPFKGRVPAFRGKK